MIISKINYRKAVGFDQKQGKVIFETSTINKVFTSSKGRNKFAREQAETGSLVEMEKGKNKPFFFNREFVQSTLPEYLSRFEEYQNLNEDQQKDVIDIVIRSLAIGCVVEKEEGEDDEE